MSQHERRWDVVVVGSANMDLVLDVARLPLPGQTLLAKSLRRNPGGKGANQAVAAARQGARTTLITAVGDDAEGAEMQRTLLDAGVDLTHADVVSGPTGLAVILLQDSGENSIVVAPGANAALTAEADVPACSCLLAQLEVSVAAVISRAHSARARGARVLLNAAPFQPLPDELISVVDLLIVNQQEALDLAESLTSSAPAPAPAPAPASASASLPASTSFLDADEAMLVRLLARFPEVIITCGGAGSVYGSAQGLRHRIAAPSVSVVDTTGAGDTYCGVLAAALAAGQPVHKAMKRASLGAALSVQRPGAIAAIPNAIEIDEWSDRVTNGPDERNA